MYGESFSFTNFYLQRKFSIFLRNDRDCKVVDPYNARKRRDTQ